MRKHVPVWLANCGAAVMGPQFDIGEFLPLWAWTGVMGVLAATTVFLYRKELRTVAGWVFRYRQKRIEEIARLADEIGRKRQMKRTAEALALRYVEDPQKRERMTEKLREKWEKEDRAARHRNGEGKE